MAKWAIENIDPTEPIKDALVRLAKDFTTEFWHSPEGEGYATVERNGHNENWRIKSEAYQDYLANLFYEECEKVPGATPIRDALSVLRGIARLRGKCFAAHVRIARDGDDVWIDLGSVNWTAVHICPCGWEVSKVPDVRFIRPSGMLPLPVPTPGGDFGKLRGFVNASDDNQWLLLKMWLVAACIPNVPCPALVLEGPQGSGKSTTQRTLRNTIDPNIAPVRSQPRAEEDLVIAARNGAIVSIDNLSSIPNWLSDALCRVVTGGGLSKRTLYSDLDETLVEVRRPIVLNGISDILSRPDLVDRAIILNLPALSERDIWDERKSLRQFEEAHPEILGGLFDTVGGVLAEIDRVDSEGIELSRMADFANTILAMESVLGMEPRSLLNVYKDNRNQASLLMIEADPFIVELVTYLERTPLPQTRSATEWLTNVNHEYPEKSKARAWPKNGRAFSQKVNRFAPNLDKHGFKIAVNREVKRRTITIKRNQWT